MAIQQIESQLRSDRRQHNRVNCNLSAKVHIGTVGVYKCIVKDISKTGARILLPSGSWEPVSFGLEITGIETKIPVKKIWSCNGMIGLAFEFPVNTN